MVIANVTHIVREDESIDKALRVFKKKCEKSGVISDMKKHDRYEKPSAKRNRLKQLKKKKLKREALSRAKEY